MPTPNVYTATEDPTSQVGNNGDIYFHTGSIGLGAINVYKKVNGLWGLTGSISIGGGTPGGSDTQVQFNDSGSFGGDAGLTYVKASDHLTLTGPFDSGAPLTLHSTGDTNDPTTFPISNPPLKLVDVNGVELFRIWAGSVGEGTIIIGSPGPSVNVGENNLIIGGQIMSSATADMADNVAVGNSALQSITEGIFNTVIGTGSGISITDGGENTLIGGNTNATESSATNVVIVGYDAITGSGVTSNAIVIGANAVGSINNTAVIGDSTITDVYFGSTSGASILHGKGDAIVFPDSDPHVAGAAYWVLGVLTKSAG